MQRALNLDSLRSSHPIEVPVRTEGEIGQIFDAISYSKGSCLLRMIAKWLGEDVMIKGVSLYLKKFKYGNVRPRIYGTPSLRPPVKMSPELWIHGQRRLATLLSKLSRTVRS